MSVRVQYTNECIDSIGDSKFLFFHTIFTSDKFLLFNGYHRLGSKNCMFRGIGFKYLEPFEVPLEEIEIDECVKNVGPVERDDTRDENQGMISKECLL